MHDPRHLLDDDQILTFIIQGYLLIKPDLRPGLNQEVCRQLEADGTVDVDLESDPHHQALLAKVPALHDVFAHPTVEGAFVSLLGDPYRTWGRHCHAIAPNSGGGWHQDDVNTRHHQVRQLTIMYYPHDVTADMGPTIIVPGTHHRNLPTDRMQSYGNFRNQVPLIVEAGTIAVTHLDLWHSASRNTSGRTRFMIKYYLDRLGEPVAPTWRHDPVAGPAKMRQRCHHARTGDCSPSDSYKVRHARYRMWQHLLGQTRLVAAAQENCAGYLMQPLS